jgi:hypothetical protein
LAHDQAATRSAPRGLRVSADLSHGQGVQLQVKEATMANKPAFRAYTVIKREGKEDFFLNIGVCYDHSDHGGYNLLLQALPLDGKIVLRRYKDDEEEEAEEKPKAKSKK